MDAIADEPGKGLCTWWAMQLTPVHTICRVNIQKNKLTLSPVNYEWIENAPKEKTSALPHLEKNEDDFLVFTAKPKEWMVFLKKHGKDKKLFSEIHAMKFIRETKSSGESRIDMRQG